MLSDKSVSVVLSIQRNSHQLCNLRSTSLTVYFIHTQQSSHPAHSEKLLFYNRVSHQKMHKRTRRPPVTVLSSTRSESTCIFHRRYRLNVRRKLLRAIVLGSDDFTTCISDNELVNRLENALLDPLPRPHTDVARIWLRYSFHVADYFQSDRLAAISPSLLERVSECGRLLALARCRTLWEDSLETNIRKSYNRYVKTAALDFILSDGSSLSWTCKRDQLILMARSCPRQTDRHKPMINVQRSLGRKLCIHHFYGRKFVALWYKFIRPIQWQNCSRLRQDYWEISELKLSWEKELATAEQLLVDGWQTIVKSVVKYALRKKVTLPSDGNVQLICRTLDTLIGLLLQQWRQENMTNFGLWLNNRQDVKNQLVFVIHVSMNDGQLKFDPSIEDISLAWGQFNDLLSVAAYRSLQSSLLVFDLIKKHLMPNDQAQPQHISSIKVKTPSEFLDHIRQVIDDAFADDNLMLTKALEKFLVFSSFLKEDSEELESLDKEGVDFDLLQERVQHYRQVLKRIETDLPYALPVGQRYLVQMDGLSSALRNKIASIIDRLLVRFSKNFTLSATNICQDYAEYADVALTVPQTTAQWIYQRDQVWKLVEKTLPEADEKILKILRCYLFMCDQMKVNESHSELAREVIMWKRRMNASQVEHGRLLRRKRSELEEALKSKRGKVAQNVTVYTGIMDSFQKMGEIESLGQYVIQARSLLFRLEEAISNVKGINEEEVHFEWEVTEYPTLAQVRERLNPFLNFFEMSSSFLTQQQNWLDSRLGSFNPDTIVKETENFAQSLSTVEEQLPDVSDVRHLLSQVETKLRDFNKVLPLIRTLGNPALRERHWEQIWDTVGVRLSSEAATSLQQLLALQLNEHLKKIEVISNSATQEMLLENSLLRMKNLWVQIVLPVENYRVGEGKVLGKVDSIQLLVEDHMMETQIMRRSPYVKPFEKDAKEWEQQLNDLQVLLEQCVFIQERWCSLEPLLTSPDVLSIAPEEARKFSAIDKNWRDVLGLISQCKQVFSLLYAERMNERLSVCIQQIQQLEKNLQNLMENKRLQYPRFFLLAEDELKRLLSLSRDPHRFATCLWRLYEGVHNLEFTAENDVTHVVSATGERLPLKEPVSYAKCKGQLDKFLNHLESVLKQTLNQVITDTLKDFDGTDLNVLLSAPSQIAILSVQVYCTSTIDTAFESGRLLQDDVAGKLDSFLSGVQKKLAASSDQVHRLTAESVTLMALYYRELLRDLTSTEDQAAAMLAWEASLKFRWTDNRVQIHVLDMCLDYGMEYIGLPPRMIAYADAKRTTLIVTNALSHHLAGILVGEPRNELLESLSHCLGQRLVRFDCSERVGAAEILRQIRGATTCGIWLCYHRLDVLGKATISFMTSLLVQLQNMASTTPPWLELSEAGLPQYGIFCLTESSRYHQHYFDANLKRTTNLSLPEVDALAQILFPGPWAAVIGFLDHCRKPEDKDEQQSSAIGILKQIFATSRRSSLSAALDSWQSARLPADEAADRTRKLTQMMPGERLVTTDWTQDPMVVACPAACQKLKLHVSEQIKWKLYHLSQAFQHARLPILLYGPRLSGKSSLLQILIESQRLAKPQRPIVMERICIGAYAVEDLMSNMSTSIIPQLVQRSGGPEKGADLVIVLNGPWITAVQDVLLDALSTEGRGILILPSTEQMTLPDHVHWVFEMNSIEHVSPGHVSQCRLIPLDGQNHLTWKCLLQSWMSTLPPVLLFLDPLLTTILPSVLEYIESSVDDRIRLASGFHPIKAVKHLLSLVRCLTDPSAEALAKKQATLDPEMRAQLQASVLFSMLWTLAVPAYMDSKSSFNEFFIQQMDFAIQNAHLFPSAKPPADQGGTVFDFKLTLQWGHGDAGKYNGPLWQPWGEELRSLPSLSREIPVNELFIATADSLRSHYLMSLFIQCGIPCILVGPRSSGKTATARHYLRTRLNRTTHQVIIVNTSKSMDAKTAQKILMGQMERRRKSVYGPTMGKKAVIFFDDVQTETLNCRTANRVDMLLKQCIQHGQVFDGQEGGPSNIIDINFVATSRIWADQLSDVVPEDEPDEESDEQQERHQILRQTDQVLQTFAPIVIEPPTLETASTILYRMLMWHLDARGFAKEFDAVIDQMISASMGIYRHLTGCPVMAAYPKRSGCRWNLRDLMRFTHGLLLSVPESIEDVGAMKRLWLHEACRVYSDRLTLLEPVALVTTYVEQSCETYFQATVSDLFAQMDMVELADLAYMNIHTIFFCDFSDPKSESRSYVEVMDMEHLTRVVNGYVTEYNNMNKRPMHYVNVFRHLMRTMAKASRVLKQPSGHLILVGPKGVGRHTLARLAGHASDSTVHQYESSCSSGENGPSKGGTWNYGDWVNALKLALIDSADDDKKCVFICSDVEFHRPECRALVNHIVSHGDLMYLFDAKERNELVEQMRAIDLQKEKTLQTDGSPAALKSMFETRMWEQIRIVIILSCEQYTEIVMDECPQVASACQTVWIHPWPSDAVADVASSIFKDIELDAEQKSWLMVVIKLIHESTEGGHHRPVVTDPQCQRYGLLMDFLHVAVRLTRNFKQEFKCRQELCCQAVEKLELAAQRVSDMEAVAQQWKDALAGLKSSEDSSSESSLGTGEKVSRTERDVEQISCQIDRAKDLLASLDIYQRAWKRQVVSLEDRIRCCQADCSLTAAALVYGAELKESQRVEMFRGWIEQCRILSPPDQHGSIITVPKDGDDYLTLLEPEVREVEAAWIMANLARDDHCIRSAVAMRHIQRVPLLIDPHNIAERWIDALNANKENRPTYLHMSAPDYLEPLSGALQLGTVVVIDITQTKLDPAIIPLILKQTFSQGSTNYIKLGSDVVEYAAEFQLYLRTQTTLEDVDLQLRLCVTVVDLTLEQPGINDTLVSALVNSERPDTEEKIQLCKQMSEIRCQLNETEQSLLNILSQSDQDWIENDAVITSLLPAITQSKLLKEKLDVVLQTRERMETQRQSFAPTAILAVQILSSLWQMEGLFRRLRFPLANFSDAVIACLEDGEGDQADDFDSNTSTGRKLASRLFSRKLKSGLDRVQRLLASLLLSFCVARSEKLCQSSFINQLATGKLDHTNTMHQKVSMDDSLVTPDPEWDEFVTEILLDGNRWRLAAAVETMAQKFLKISQKVEFNDYVTSISDVSSVTPLLMFVEPGVDLLAIVSRLCREFDFPEDRARFAAVAGLDSLNWVEVEDCVRRGNWLVLQGFAHLRSMINNVRVLLEYLAADNISAEFKLFILWEAFDDDIEGDEVGSVASRRRARLPQLLMENCRTVYIEHVHTFEDCFQEFIRSAEFDRLMNDPLRACASYPLKVKTAALLLILRLVVWDRWGCVIPLIELWQTAKQIATLTSVKNHDWAATFHRVTIGNLEEYVPSDSRQEFVCRFMPDLVNGSRTSYKRAFDQLMDTWSSNLTLPSADYQFIFDCLGDPLNETRRQTLLSQRLWSQLVRGFGGDVLHVESVNVTVTEDDESEMDSKDH